MVAHEQSCNIISDRISNNTLPQIKVLNTVNQILMHFCSFVLNWILEAACHSAKCDVINDIKLFLIYRRKFVILSNQMSHYKNKYIKMSLIVIVQDLQRFAFYKLKEILLYYH